MLFGIGPEGVFWLDIVSNSLDKKLSKQFENGSLASSLIELVAFSRVFFPRIVDFEVPVNAAHSEWSGQFSRTFKQETGF